MWYVTKGNLREASGLVEYREGGEYVIKDESLYTLSHALSSSLEELSFVFEGEQVKMEMSDLDRLDKAGISVVSPSSFLKQSYSLQRGDQSCHMYVYPCWREDKMIYLIDLQIEGEERDQLLFISHTFTSFLNDFVVSFRGWWLREYRNT